jgi:small subunit ribosomal protein S20
MPVTRTAKKALRQNRARYTKNAAQKAELAKVVKNYKKLVAAKNLDEAAKQLSLVYQKLDKAAKTHLIKKNTASRLKSRLSAKLKTK